MRQMWSTFEGTLYLIELLEKRHALNRVGGEPEYRLDDEDAEDADAIKWMATYKKEPEVWTHRRCSKQRRVKDACDW